MADDDGRAGLVMTGTGLEVLEQLCEQLVRSQSIDAVVYFAVADGAVAINTTGGAHLEGCKEMCLEMSEALEIIMKRLHPEVRQVREEVFAAERKPH